MTDLFDFRNDEGKTGPVYILNENDEIDYDATAPTGKWLLTSELYITGGGKKYCCNEFVFMIMADSYKVSIAVLEKHF